MTVMTRTPPTPSTRPGSPANRTAAGWSVDEEPHDSPVAAALWRAYYTEVSDRWYLLHEGRPTDPDELEREVAADTGAYLAPPDGVLLVARYGGEPVGTAGVRLTDAATAELKRVFLLPEARGRGGAGLLVSRTIRPAGVRGERPAQRPRVRGALVRQETFAKRLTGL